MTHNQTAAAVEYPPHLLQRVVARLAPYLGTGASEISLEEARATALELITDLHPVTGKELQLVAQIWALSLGSMNCLGCSAHLTVEQAELRLRITQDAVRLHDLCAKARRQLEVRQRERHLGQALGAEARAFDEAEFNAVMTRVRDTVTFARARGEASRVAQELEARTGTGDAASVARRQAEKAWAEDLQNFAAWAQQTRH